MKEFFKVWNAQKRLWRGRFKFEIETTRVSSLDFLIVIYLDLPNGSSRLSMKHHPLDSLRVFPLGTLGRCDY